MVESLRALEALLRKQAELKDTPRAPATTALPRDLEQPPSIFELNRLYEARFDVEQTRERLARALAASREALATAKENLDAAEKRRRQARTSLEDEEDPSRVPEAERLLQRRELSSRVAQERVHLRTLELRLAEESDAEAEETAPIVERIEAVRKALEASRDDSAAGFAAVASRVSERRAAAQAASRRLASAELRLEAARERFSRQADPPADWVDQLEVLAATRDAVALEVALETAQLERLDEQAKIWRRWEALLRREGTREEVAGWRDELADYLDGLARAGELREAERRDAQRRLIAVRERLARSNGSAGVLEALEGYRAALARLLDAQGAEAAELAAHLRLSERVLAEIRDRRGDFDVVAYLRGGVDAARDTWSFEITTVDDAPITVGSLVLALLLAGIGLWGSRRGSAFVGRLATDRLRLDAGAAHALQTLSFYLLLVSFTLLALRAVHFPLTAFTVLGGALAIGIGFGSQNVMNNFISGLILMLERPVRAGDVVEVDANHGTIERIGARSTQIRSVDGRHIVVPNSFFLENNVVNWTLSDDLIRTSVIVGVVYGSPTRLVEQLIRQAIEEDDGVLPNPEPVLLFNDFGDNSLDFHVHFWVRARSPMATRKVQSRLRFRIDDLFRENDLVIAFPQRDVHLDTVAPVEVRILREDDPSTSEKTS